MLTCVGSRTAAKRRWRDDTLWLTFADQSERQENSLGVCESALASPRP